MVDLEIWSKGPDLPKLFRGAVNGCDQTAIAKDFLPNISFYRHYSNGIVFLFGTEYSTLWVYMRS